MILNPIIGSKQETPVIDVSSAGLITATAGKQSATRQLSTQGGKSVRPTTVQQTAVASGKYTTGAVTVEGSPYFIPGNIRSGVSIFGVSGNYTGDAPNLSLVSIRGASSVTTTSAVFKQNTSYSGKKLTAILMEAGTMLISSQMQAGTFQTMLWVSCFDGSGQSLYDIEARAQVQDAASGVRAVVIGSYPYPTGISVSYSSDFKTITISGIRNNIYISKQDYFDCHLLLSDR